METWNDMSLALERNLVPATAARAVATDRETAASRLNIAVIFTSVESTLAALRRAGLLAARLGAHITLLVLQVVPYPLPLTSPPILVDFNERRFRVLAGQGSVDTTVQLYLCRDRWETISAILRPHSLIVVGGRKRQWWPTAEQRLARRLRNAGHEVIFAEAA
jgi:hypothetical protein